MFINVILPLPLKDDFTYQIPEGFGDPLLPGQRVIVPFGKNKWYSGIIRKTGVTPPKYRTKEVLEVLDVDPVISDWQLSFWEWISSYYMCSLGEVMQAALPAALKWQSETVVRADRDAKIEWDQLSDRAFLVMEAFEHQQQLTLKEVSDIIDRKTIRPVIHELLDRGLIVLEAEIREKVRPRWVRFISLHQNLSDEEWNQVFESLRRAPSQSRMLMGFLQLQGPERKEVSEKELLAHTGGTRQHIVGLLDKGILKEREEQFLPDTALRFDEDTPLTAEQSEALKLIEEGRSTETPVLLWGVTGSGKTEVYVQAIRKVLSEGKNALYMLPEIALTAQLILRLKGYLGDGVLVYHSRLSERERMETWKAILNADGPVVVLGARSALMLPFRHLGLIVVDEEHETSYKQHDPAPRYHARDTAIYLARKLGAGVVLGSATPSLESFFNVQNEKYLSARLEKRFSGVAMPKIELIDLVRQHKQRTMHGHFSQPFLDAIRETLGQKEKVILFQNRRGYSPVIECKTCGHVSQCVNCDVSLTYHKAVHLLKCHYCGYTQKPLSTCPACGSNALQMMGMGTEKIEDELQLLIPEASIERMDLDATRKKNAFQELINRFEEGQIDILVGTQMVTKGLDFHDVGLVGIVNADSLLKFPDFRAHERAYQLMEQVAGRSGRREKQGKVLIQTYEPEHRILQQLIDYDYMSMAKEQLQERKHYQYPPYFRLIHILLKHGKKEVVNEAARRLGMALRDALGNRVMGPEYPAIPRVKNQYLKQIYIRLERKASPTKVKAILAELEKATLADAPLSGVRVIYDVDPY
ncbi:MAG: primosomal protein N' [Bacteroidota bacterium]|nr:primosomal protein N' [Bacteroidota bacterium]MDX5426608.1 primosomal protein N' [Bacteroidota bacterium]MDX5447094.1 primosomal protein N' [Bacteroidota bacterium]MDX5504617.1 primosomal protein N' [Bacteroidota bacterium]